MKVVILAGGQQSALSNDKDGIPKPMADIGGKPLLWHIMKHFAGQGYNEFIVCGGYKVDLIKEYFMDFYIYESDITVDLFKNTIEVHKKRTENWRVTVVDTGVKTATGNRIEIIEDYIREDEFLVTYGDCLSDINVQELVRCHRSSEKKATMVLAKPSGRSRLLPLNEEGNICYETTDIDSIETSWINGDCFVFDRSIFHYIDKKCDIERNLLRTLSKQNQLATYRHSGYWSAIETRRDLAEAEMIWNGGMAPWTRKL